MAVPDACVSRTAVVTFGSSNKSCFLPVKVKTVPSWYGLRARSLVHAGPFDRQDRRKHPMHTTEQSQPALGVRGMRLPESNSSRVLHT